MRGRFVVCVILLGCSSSDDRGGGSAATQHLHDLLDDYYAAFARQCATLAGCYPALNVPDDDTCWGPTATGRHGWGTSSAEERPKLHACLDTIYAHEPEAIVTYMECFARIPDAVDSCLRACPADVTPCDRDVSPSEHTCEQQSGIDLTDLARELCGL